MKIKNPGSLERSFDDTDKGGIRLYFKGDEEKIVRDEDVEKSPSIAAALEAGLLTKTGTEEPLDGQVGEDPQGGLADTVAGLVIPAVLDPSGSAYPAPKLFSGASPMGPGPNPVVLPGATSVHSFVFSAEGGTAGTFTVTGPGTVTLTMAGPDLVHWQAVAS